MSHALVVNNAIQSEGGLPDSARRLDDQAWVMGLPYAAVPLREACGYYLVTPVARPADTTTDTYDRSLTLVSGVPTETWTQRPKTQAELTAATEATNHNNIVANLDQDMVNMQATIDATNATINANPATYIKNIARMNRRLGRLALNDLDGTT